MKIGTYKMNFLGTDLRDRRNFLNRGVSLNPMQYNIANYSTDVDMTKKSDMKSFEEEIFSKIHSIPDPLKKNLADTVITANKQNSEPQTPIMEHQQFFYPPPIDPEPGNPPDSHRNDFYNTITGVTSYISSFFGAISGAVFHRRPKSPAPQYYDCFDCDSHIDTQMATESWHGAHLADQNKKRAPEQISCTNGNMNNCRAAVSQCEDKLNTVRNLLKNKGAPTSTPSQNSRYRIRRPKRAFVDPGSVTDNYEEDFTDENYVSLANDEYIEYFVRPNNQNEDGNIEAPKMKVKIDTVGETTEIVKIIPEVNIKDVIVDKNALEEPVIVTKINSEVQTKASTSDSNKVIKTTPKEIEDKKEVISSCEEKMAKLKAMIQERKSKNKALTDSIPEPVKEDPRPSKPIKVTPIENKQDKHFKNPNRHTDKRMKLKLRKNIRDDMLFANEIDSDDISSADNSPAPMSTMQRIPETLPVDIKTSDDYFDELKGRFQSASVESDDSFQIVFTDSPKNSRNRIHSDCDSEDSFIVFEESPDSCYTSNDVFGDHELEDSAISDTESDISDSGCGIGPCKMSHQFSRTVSDLTDDSLYEDSRSVVKDEVDCAVRAFEEIPSSEVVTDVSEVKTGLLLDEAKKLKRKGQPPKKVTFSPNPPSVRVMRVWAFAARQARVTHWEEVARDRDRFRRRIADVDMAVSWVLKPQHRSRVMFQRIMPWRNQQRRKEAEEKKIREQQEKIRAEEDKMKKEREDVIQQEWKKESNIIRKYEDDVYRAYKQEFRNKNSLNSKKKDCPTGRIKLRKLKQFLSNIEDSNNTIREINQLESEMALIET